jgi:hypothetical protein
MQYVPIALACGHLITGIAHFDYDPDREPEETTLVECEEGCGLQRFVVDPDAKGTGGEEV